MPTNYDNYKDVTGYFLPNVTTLSNGTKIIWYSFAEGEGGFSAEQKAQVVEYFNYISSFTQVTFQEGHSGETGTIEFRNVSLSQYASSCVTANFTGAWKKSATPYTGPIYVNIVTTNSNMNSDENKGVLLHEIGHAIGLDHPMDSGDDLASLFGQYGRRPANK